MISVIICGMSYMLLVPAAAVPSGFLLLLPGVWLGSRFPPIVSLVYGVASAIAILGMTLVGMGVFSTMSDEGVALVFAHLLATAMIVVPLLLSLTTADLRDAVATVKERNSLLDLTLESMTTQVVVADENGNYLQANSAAMTSLDDHGYVADQLPDQGAYDMYLPDGTPLRHEDLPLLLAVRGELMEAKEYHLRPPGQPTSILEITTRELPRTSSRTPRRFVCLTEDVTQQRAETNALTSFAGVVAHDLNNPLTVVTAWSETILEELNYEGRLDKEPGVEMVGRIQGAALHMRNLISDLLSFATTRNRIPQPQAVELEDVVRTVLAMQLTPTRALLPHFTVKDLVPVWGDPTLVQQLMDNVIGNAVKYVAPDVVPEIVIQAHPKEDGFVEITVADNGLGIPEAERESIFHNFHRAHKAVGIKGTGLGLAICREIAHAHGGDVVAEENPEGGGSLFRITLPSTPEAYASTQV